MQVAQGSDRDPDHAPIEGGHRPAAVARIERGVGLQVVPAGKVDSVRQQARGHGRIHGATRAVARQRGAVAHGHELRP